MLCEILGTLFLALAVAIVFGAWIYCLKRPDVCQYWGQERRVIQQPLDYECRRKNED